MEPFQDSTGESEGEEASLTCHSRQRHPHSLSLSSWPLPYLVISGGIFSLIVLIRSTYARTCAYTRRPWGLLTLAPRHPPELGMSLPSVALCLKHLHSVHKAKSIRSSREADGLSLAAGIPCERAGLGLCVLWTDASQSQPFLPAADQLLKQTRCSYKRKLQLLLWTGNGFLPSFFSRLAMKTGL